MGGGGFLGDVFEAIGLKPEKPPKPPALPPPPKLDEKKAKTAGAAAAKKKKQQAMAAYGGTDTIMSGPGGLGAVGAGNLQQNTLLGGY